MGDGSAAAADSDGRRVGGIVGKRRPRAPNSRRSGSHRFDVVGVGTGKQGRKLEVDVAGLVGVENVAIAGRDQLPTVSTSVSIRA